MPRLEPTSIDRNRRVAEGMFGDIGPQHNKTSRPEVYLPAHNVRVIGSRPRSGPAAIMADVTGRAPAPRRIAFTTIAGLPIVHLKGATAARTATNDALRVQAEET